ncbi:HsdM family class I SAM-dependent methyltransferase [Vaccinium witches'-broom phytoplasma]|uniref:HsdM family class I SAM-dependent methyltransferase n=1 Tax=Vaccinium witches'-broom phytoplasma TaxID=85642 RepID=UPI00036CF549|nr:N-6 DNA methylase [Vaccinium witches'-broom phytoplasma]
MSFYSNITERDIEIKVITKLQSLGYIIDPQNPNKDVYLQKPKYKEEYDKLNGQRPDFIIYSGNDKPLAIIETKKNNSNLLNVEKQAESYAEKLGVKLIFSYDGYRLFSKHLFFQEELQYGGNPLTDFIEKNFLEQFVQTPKIDLNFGKNIKNEAQFIKELKKLEDLLRTTGLKQGDKRFTEFCKILFLRLISEKEKNNNIWLNIINAPEENIIHIINGNLKKLNKKYQMDQYGEELKLEPKYHSRVVKCIVKKLNEIDFINTSLDVKGSAFEFFLGHRGLNDDLAQYFTPRNIIRFMCNLIEPKPGEKIYDPFCGSGGILINAFEYIKKQINPDDKISLKNLKENTIYGTDINSIAYVAKMNMILVGDGHANITEQKGGSLINKRTNQYDIVMTNIPFNLPKNENLLYDIPSSNSNSICVQHCLDALSKNLNSRACIIIPEQFIFIQELKETRTFIINNYNLKIFSLPRRVFEPYTTAKTCIMHLQYTGKPGNLEFIYIDNVGFSLDNQKKEINKNNLIEYLKNPDLYQNAHKFSYEAIANNNFSFQLFPNTNQINELITLSEILEISRIPIKLDPEREYFEITISSHGKGVRPRMKNGEIYKKGKDIGSSRNIIKDEDFCYSKLGANQGAFGEITDNVRNALYSNDFVCFKLKKEFIDLNLDFLIAILTSNPLLEHFKKITKGTAQTRVYPDAFLNTKLPYTKAEFLEYFHLLKDKLKKHQKIKNDFLKSETELKQAIKQFLN